MDFVKIIVDSSKKGKIDIFPSYKTNGSKDLMIRGNRFHAFWDEDSGLWSFNDKLLVDKIDAMLREAYNETRALYPEASITVRYLSDSHTGALSAFRKYVINQSDEYILLDSELTFLNTETKREDYASKRLPYSLEPGEAPAYEQIISTLYDEPERRKLEWAIGAVVAGEAKNIDKFIVIYGPPGSGKGTILKIIQKLFQGYYTMFDAKALVSNTNQFSTEVFKNNPLVAIQEDGDLSKIEDNTKLNSIVSHEEMVMNEKHKAQYTTKVNCFLFMGTNSNVKITERKAGIIRRLINVVPSGRLIPPTIFKRLESQINFELGAIAYHCLKVFERLGPDFYHNYQPTDMILRTNHFYNYVNDNLDEFVRDGGITLLRAYTMYKEFCKDSDIDYALQKFKFRDELKNYFKEFYEWARPPSEEGRQVKNWYANFDLEKFYGRDGSEDFKHIPEPEAEALPRWLQLQQIPSLLDKTLSYMPAQYSNADGTPFEAWDRVERNLEALDTSKEHYVRMPYEHIVIDFDLKNSSGEKSLELNLAAAASWKPTYAETSRSGKGLHLHYIYSGDPGELNSLYAPDIEIKVFSGKQALRRKVGLCNDLEVATLTGGLPLKTGGKKVIDTNYAQTEKGLRSAIKKGLAKEVHSSTKPSIDFIHHILEEAYASGLTYDVSDLMPRIISFAMSSTNQSEYCIKKVSEMKFKSEHTEISNTEQYDSDELVFFDVEVFPNLFVVCYKFQGPGKEVVALVNPSPSMIEDLLKFKLVGFNCRRYDNHILYAWYLGCTNYELYKVSKSLIDKQNKFNGYSEAYNISYTDIWDFNYNKQSLKKWEIQLGIHHQELGLPWDEDVPEDKWELVAEYCKNDVIATEATFDANIAHWKARQILAVLSGLTVNDTTNSHTAKIILKGDYRAKDHFEYTDLSETFPGYTFDAGKSHYRGEIVGEGGYVYAEPGVYGNVALLDVASMHPTSICVMNMFGKYTQYLKELLDVRIAIKHKDYETAKRAFDGRLAEYLTNPEEAKALSDALKLAINSVYGLTSARFDSKFKDSRNIDNICAKRGALFMVDLKHAVQERGYTVAHIKTDSIKIPDADVEIIDFVCEFGRQYGYTFEHEATYDRFALLNDSTYVCRTGTSKWSSTGTQLIHPYVFKTLFSNESLTLQDYIETRAVDTAIYIDLNEGLGEDEHNYQFVGKVGAFYPVTQYGGILLRQSGDKFDAVNNTKGYRWMEAEVLAELYDESIIDKSYYQNLADKATDAISNWCDFGWFISEQLYDKEQNGIFPF